MMMTRRQLEEIGFSDDCGYAASWLLNFYFGAEEFYLGIDRDGDDGVELPATCHLWMWGDEGGVSFSGCDEETIRAIAACIGHESPEGWYPHIHIPQVRSVADELGVELDPLLVMARLGEVEHQRAREGGESK